MKRTAIFLALVLATASAHAATVEQKQTDLGDLAPGAQAEAYVLCPNDGTVAGGGYEISGNADAILIYATHPLSKDGQKFVGWIVKAVNTRANNRQASVNVYALCN